VPTLFRGNQFWFCDGTDTGPEALAERFRTRVTVQLELVQETQFAADDRAVLNGGVAQKLGFHG
jgi:hypothetical protein